MNIKVEEILMVIVAFIIGYFLNGIINQNLVEGAASTNCSINNKENCKVDNNCEWKKLPFGKTKCVPAPAPTPAPPAPAPAPAPPAPAPKPGQMPESDQVRGPANKKGVFDMIMKGESSIEKFCSNKAKADRNILYYYKRLHDLLKERINNNLSGVYTDCEAYKNK